MEKKIVIVCEGKNDVSYLNALQRFVENDISLPPGQIDPFLRFVPFPELEGTCTGQYDKIAAAYSSAAEIYNTTAFQRNLSRSGAPRRVFYRLANPR